MISVYDIGNENFDRNGNVVIEPTSGTVKQVAGGNYEITLTVPVDAEGKWSHLVPGAVIKAPVPKEVIPNAYAGVAADVYKTNTAAELRESALAPSTITYNTWSGNTTYEVGNKVSYNSRNYKCTYFDDGSGQRFVPPNNSSWWKEIPRTTDGAPVIVSMSTGAELYFVEDVDSTWYVMSTPYGITGYIEKSKVTYDRHLDPSETTPRIITEQLFRLQEPTIDDEHRTVTVNGVHVSYDLAGILVQDVSFTQASPAMALNLIVNSFMMNYRGEIATDLVGSGIGTYSETIKGKNGMFALLDPDSGIVHNFGAKFTRDNWDLFILERAGIDTGIRMAYGKNVRGISWKRSSANLVTRIVPKAKDEKGNDLFLPEMWVDSPLINNYPVVKMEMLSVKGQVGKDKAEDSGVWTLSDLQDEMRAKAEERFTVDKADQITQEVTVQFEQLGDTAEYAWLKPLQDLVLYDTVIAEDPVIGLDMTLYVTEIEYDILKKKVVGMKLSNVSDYGGRTVTGYNVQNKSIGGNKLKDEVASDIVDEVLGKVPEYADPDATRPASVTVTDNDPTLSWGNQSKVGTVQGTDLHVTMPSKPTATVTDSDPTLSWGTRSAVGTVDGTDLHVTMPGDPAEAISSSTGNNAFLYFPKLKLVYVRIYQSTSGGTTASIAIPSGIPSPSQLTVGAVVGRLSNNTIVGYGVAEAAANGTTVNISLTANSNNAFGVFVYKTN